MPPLCFQRPWRSISWVGAPFWTMRRAMPTRPLWPLKNSQSANPAALAITLTRRAIWDSDSPKTFLQRQLPPAGWRKAPPGGGGDGDCGALGLGVGLGADDGDAAAAVVPAHNIAPSVRVLAAVANIAVGEWAEGQGYERYFGSSIKGEATIDWSDRKARAALLAELAARLRIA